MAVDDLVGATISERFILKRKIGQGGYGAVFEGEQLSINRKCAVKVLAPRVTNDPKTAKRFEHEARTTSLLTHPNTVVIYDFGKDEHADVLFLAMEYLDGESLSSVINRRGVLGIAESLHIAHQIALSLDDAHEAGVVHRDVKPQNVMLLQRGQDAQFVKVIDFGLVKIVNGDVPTKTTFVELTKSGVVVGTPAYMSPEQIDKGVMDGRTDQYSLAITIYVMLTGRTPFVGANPIDVATKHLLEQPLPPSVYRTSLSVSEAFEAAILRALSKDPSERFDTCTAFIDALIEASKFAGIEEISSNVTVNARSSTDEKTTEPMLPSETDTVKMNVDEIDQFGDTLLVDSDQLPSTGLQTDTVKTVRASPQQLPSAVEDVALESAPAELSSNLMPIVIVSLFLIAGVLIVLALVLS